VFINTGARLLQRSLDRNSDINRRREPYTATSHLAERHNRILLLNLFLVLVRSPRTRPSLTAEREHHSTDPTRHVDSKPPMPCDRSRDR